MPAKEIKALRESGELKEALKLALQEYEQDKTNIWGKRNLVWVYYDMLKSFQGNLDAKENVLEVLENIKKLELPTNENLFFQQHIFLLPSRHCLSVRRKKKRGEI